MDYNPVGWFEIPVLDMDRAKTFYEKLFGYDPMPVHELGPITMAWFPYVENAKGSTGTLAKNENYVPSHEGALIYFTAPDIDGTLAKVEGLGGKVLHPKKAIGDYGFVAFLEDTEGNRIALHSTKK